MEARMKLYVVGESTPEPAKWSIWSEWSLVLAGSPEDALRVAGDAKGYTTNREVCEIPMDKPMHLVTMPEPSWGDDI
jgi:hypothetical protein